MGRNDLDLVRPDIPGIGISISGSFLLWSMFLRIAEGHCIGPVRFHSPTRPHDKDAVIFMGRRNSCFVLEGSREDVSRWTGLGLEQKEDRLAVILTNLMRFGSLLQLLFIFAVIPNGTTWDQVGFILFNALGQLNLLVCGRLGARRCMESLDKVSETEVGTRTHVYGELLRKFGDGKWVETASLLPETDIWSRWRKLVLENRERDCKALYAQSVNEEECFNRTESAGSEWTNIGTS
ncbi:MAG: hypothetical protein M1827_000361 [Pycnora praestabilis]|nr:MAG: hypothetical protein M1827_000361 [Pycnora praestabilis]